MNVICTEELVHQRAQHLLSTQASLYGLEESNACLLSCLVILMDG